MKDSKNEKGRERAFELHGIDEDVLESKLSGSLFMQEARPQSVVPKRMQLRLAIRTHSSNLIFFGNGPQFLCIEDVLLPSTCKFVPDEIIPGNYVHLYFLIDETLDSVLPGFIEGEAIDALQDIHAGWRLADLESRSVHEISRTQSVERCAILLQCPIDGSTIHFIRADEEIQVFCRARLGVNTESITPNNQVFNGVFVKCV